MKIKTIALILLGLVGVLGGVYVVSDIILSESKPIQTIADVQDDFENSTRSSVDQDFSDISESFNQQDYGKVIELSRNFLQDYPNNHFSANVLFKIAESYYRLGKLPQAKDGYTKVIDSFPDSQMAQFARIKLDLLGKVDQESSMDQFLKLETAESGYQECRDLYKGRDFDGAIKGFEAFLQKYPNSDLASNAQYWLAECYYAKDDLRRAKREFERVKENYPGSSKIPSANRKILMSSQKLARQDSDDKQKVIYERALAKYNEKDYRGAIAGFRAFLKEYPQSTYAPNAYYWIAESYYAAADYQDGVYKNTLINLGQSEKYFKAVISKFPKSEKAADAKTKLQRVGMITSYVKARKAYLAKDYNQAIRDFKSYLNRYPKSYLAANCQYWAGVCYFDQEQYARARIEFQRVEKNYPEHHKAKDAARKLKEIEKILGSEAPRSGDLSDEESDFEAVRAFFIQGDMGKLVSSGSVFLQNYPNSQDVARVQFMLAEGYYREKDFNRAASYYGELLSSGKMPEEQALIQDRYQRCLAQRSQDALEEMEEGDAEGRLNADLERGIAFCDNGDWDAGLEMFLSLRGRFEPESVDNAVLLYWIGKYYYRAKDFAKTKLYLSRVDEAKLTKDEREVCYYCLAAACYKLEDFDVAMDEIDKFLVEFGSSSQYYYSILDMKVRIEDNR